MADIAYVKIHPAIGVARVGNHPTEFFYGPEKPFDVSIPAGGYKAEDQGVMKIKRQAARFRLYAYDDNDTLIGELTSDNANITWKAHIANKKAVWERFDQPQRNIILRNTEVRGENRHQLIIDPGERQVSGKNQGPVSFDTGSFLSYNPGTNERITQENIYLGELQTDEKGRLVVLGGRGVSKSPTGVGRADGSLQYANNPGWYDDVSDGPIDASVTIEQNGVDVSPPVKGAWVVCAPPNYAPPVQAIVSTYDMLFDRAVRHGVIEIPEIPSFAYHIYPLLEATLNARHVYSENDPLGNPHKNFHFLLAPSADMSESIKRAIFSRLRVPKGLRDALTRPGNISGNMPKLRDDADNYSADGRVDEGLALTETQYLMLERWVNGQFNSDGEHGQIPQPDNEINPSGLDQAALRSCIGGAFYPGIEMSWFLREDHALELDGADFLRIKQPQTLFGEALSAGDVTKHMALPWQADFLKCTKYGNDTPGWWPSARPNEVLNVAGEPHIWDDVIRSHQDLVNNWWRLGFVINDENGFHEVNTNAENL